MLQSTGAEDRLNAPRCATLDAWRCADRSEQSRAAPPTRTACAGSTAGSRPFPCSAPRDDPLVVDLGYGASGVTALELQQRLARTRPDVEVAGPRDRTGSSSHGPRAAGRGPRRHDAVRTRGARGLRPGRVRGSRPRRSARRGHPRIQRAAPVRRVRRDRGLAPDDEPPPAGRTSCRGDVRRDRSRVQLGRRRCGRPEAPDDLAPARRVSRFRRSWPNACRRCSSTATSPASGCTTCWPSSTASGGTPPRSPPTERRSAGSRSVGGLRDAGWPVRAGRTRWKLGELTVDWSAVEPRGFAWR